MEKLLRRKGIKAIVVVVALHMAMGFNSARAFAQQSTEVMGGSQTGIIPDSGDVQAKYEAAQALVDAKNQMLEEINKGETYYEGEKGEEEATTEEIYEYEETGPWDFPFEDPFDGFDSDGDGIPDDIDPYPYDADNDGVPDDEEAMTS